MSDLKVEMPNVSHMVDTERLNLFLESKKISTRELADKLGISHAAVSQIRSGKNHMSSKSMYKLFLLYPELCPRWFIQGTGHMFCEEHLSEKALANVSSKDEEINSLKEALKAKTELLEAKEEIIQLLKKLNP
jgi:transcriptional regulator with XRE-family HTH domain